MINSSQKKMKNINLINTEKKKQRKPENNIHRGMETFKRRKNR